MKILKISLYILPFHQWAFVVSLILISINGCDSYYGGYYDSRVNVPAQRRGFWCNYVVRRNVSCAVSHLDRIIEKYHYLCSGIYAEKKYCVGYRAKYVTRYSKEYRLQPVMIKDCCPGFNGIECDKECFNCTTVERMQTRIEKLERNQKLLAQRKLQSASNIKDASASGPPGPQGEAGPPGPQGLVGPVGPFGPAGQPGLRGLKGEKGEMGVRGPQGPPGPPGNALPLTTLPVKGNKLAERFGITRGDYIIGSKGQKGEAGEKGDQGARGQPGIPGEVKDGLPGRDGKNGLKGSKGSTGARGKDGFGRKGEKGSKGSPGDNGIKGEIGEKGSCDKIKGIDGKNGAKGGKGDQGILGPIGPKGMRGEKGERGPHGIPGLPAPGTKELLEVVKKLEARVILLEKNRCNCGNENGLGNRDIFEINKK